MPLLISPWLSRPYLGSSNRIQPMVSGRAGRKNDSQKKNSKVPFMGMSVRAISQAKKAPTSSAIACRVIAKVNVLVIALTIPGVVKALIHPSMPQIIGWPGRAVWKLLRIIKNNGVSTRKATTMIKSATGSDGRWSERKLKNDARSNVTVWFNACDLSLMIGPMPASLYAAVERSSIIVGGGIVIHVEHDAVFG